MTRWASTLNATTAAQPAVAMVCLCDLNFDTGTIRVHDGYAQLSFNGNTYSGLGDFAGLDVVEESTETIAKTIRLSLSYDLGALPDTILQEVMTQNFQGRTVVLYIGLLNTNTMQWVDTPEEIWGGRMDYATIEITDEKVKIELSCENRLNREPLIARYTDVDQQLAFPGDTFFNLVWMIPLAQTGWGGVTVQYPANVAPTGRGTTANGGRGAPGGPFNQP